MWNKDRMAPIDQFMDEAKWQRPSGIYTAQFAHKQLGKLQNNNIKMVESADSTKPHSK